MARKNKKLAKITETAETADAETLEEMDETEEIIGDEEVKPKKYIVYDPEGNERIFTRAVHGFDFRILPRERKEINKQEADYLREHYPYLVVEELEGETMFGQAVS